MTSFSYLLSSTRRQAQVFLVITIVLIMIILFHQKFFSKGKYSIQESEFYPFADFAHDAQTVHRKVGLLYIT